MPWRTFLFADLGAALVSVPLGFGLGYLFTSQIKGILADMYRVERWLGLGGLLVVTIVLLVKIWRWYHHPPIDALVDEGVGTVHEV